MKCSEGFIKYESSDGEEGFIKYESSKDVRTSPRSLLHSGTECISESRKFVSSCGMHDISCYSLVLSRTASKFQSFGRKIMNSLSLGVDISLF